MLEELRRVLGAALPREREQAPVDLDRQDPVAARGESRRDEECAAPTGMRPDLESGRMPLPGRAVDQVAIGDPKPAHR
jgi:hypothetical protein